MNRNQRQVGSRVDPRSVPYSRHCIFLRGLPYSVVIDNVRNFFDNEVGGKCRVEFFKTSEDKRHLFLALRFETHEHAKEVLERFDNKRVLDHLVEITWFKDMKRARDEKQFGNQVYNRSYQNSGSNSRPRRDRNEEERRNPEIDASRSKQSRRQGNSLSCSRSPSRTSNTSFSSRSRSLSKSERKLSGDNDFHATNRRRVSNGDRRNKDDTDRMIEEGEDEDEGEDIDEADDIEGMQPRAYRRFPESQRSDYQPLSEVKKTNPSNSSITNSLNNNPGKTGLYSPNQSYVSNDFGKSQKSKQNEPELEYTVAKKSRFDVDVESLPERIKNKKLDIEMSYRNDCETFTTVAKLLIEKNREMQDRILKALKEVLLDLCQQGTQDLQLFIENNVV